MLSEWIKVDSGKCFNPRVAEEWFPHMRSSISLTVAVQVYIPSRHNSITMVRALKVRLEPDSVQRRTLDRMFSLHTYLHNALITASVLYYSSNGCLPTAYDLNLVCTKIRHNCPMFSELSAMAMQQTARRVADAMVRCRDNTSSASMDARDEDEYPFHRPRFRKQSRTCSVTFPSNQCFSFVSQEEGGRREIRIQKIPGTMRFYNQYTRIEGMPKTCTVKRRRVGRRFEYYASIVYDDDADGDMVVDIIDRAVGIDVGVMNTVALSNGNVFGNRHAYDTQKERIEQLSMKMSSQQRYTKEWFDTQARLQHCYDRLRNMRKNDTEYISRYIADRYDTVVMEDVSVRGLRKISSSGKSKHGYDDASLGILMRRIGDKVSRAGHEIILVDPKGTSRMCSVCGNDVPKDLKTRVHECPYCGAVRDRDVNAAVNIKRLGLSRNPSRANG